MSQKTSLYAYAIRFFLVFLFVFFVGHFCFLFYHFDLVKSEGFFSIVSCFKHAFFLDLSASSAFFSLPLLFLLAGLFCKENNAPKTIKHLSLFFLSCIAILQAADLFLYDEWQTKVNYKAMSYLFSLNKLSEAFHTVSYSIFLSVLLVAFFQVFIVYRVFRKWFFRIDYLENKGLLNKMIFVLLVPGLSFLALRGGWRPISINISDTYYSSNQALNDAAVNTAWNLAQSISENRFLLKEQPLQFYSKEEAKQIVDSLYAVRNKASQAILKTKRPNIVLVILESWNAEVMHSFGGQDSVTPCFDKLVKDGLSFQKCYSPGLRSDLGIPSILSGFPADPYSAIASQPSKYKSLASWTKCLKNEGYYTSFLFGGQLVYGNIKSYIYWNDFDKIQEGENLNDDYLRGRLGVHDEFLFSQAISDASTFKNPFFSVVYTLSSHPPYDIPMKYVIAGGANENGYLNSVYYSDRCIGKFMEEARKQTWYDNTLFVFTADHGHATPHCKEFYSKEMHHIPLLFYGNVLLDSLKGSKHNHVCSQTDIVSTVLNQLKIATDRFKFSKDLLNPLSAHFASYIFYLGYGWSNDSINFEYEMRYKSFENSSFDTMKNSKVLRQGRGYIQHVFDEYESY